LEDDDDEEEEDDDDDEEDDDDDDDDTPIPETDPAVLDTMFRVGELMSVPPTGGVTIQAFSVLPPISLIMGKDGESDLSKRELSECWVDGALGATRVDRNGFGRVWKEVQEYYDDELMNEARERSLKKNKKRKGSATAAASAPPTTTVMPTTTTTTTPPPSPQVVGSQVPPEILEKQIKNMSDTDMDLMLQQMQEMTPEQADRMKVMGVDPAMMQKTAAMMKDNPMMKFAAKTMMKNMSADQMQKMSQQAQDQMKNMTPEQMEKMMEDLKKKGL